MTAQLPEFAISDALYSSRAVTLESSIIREILKFSSLPDVISFAGGYPAPELFPAEELRQAADHVLTQKGEAALQYGLSSGYGPLREFLADRINRLNGTELAADNILITSGSQQALDVIGRAFLEPGDYVVTTRPTYVGAMQAFNFYGAKYALTELDDDGMRTDQLPPLIEKYKPKLIYTVPNFQNPTGVTLSDDRRHLMVEAAGHYNIPIIDDNPYGELRYSGQPRVSLKLIGGDAVVQLGTFSKIIAPGLRLGWIAGPAPMMKVFEKVKQCADLHTNQFAQVLVHEFASTGGVRRHVPKIIEAYSERLNVMLKALGEFLPDNVRWTRPEGGLFLWIELPEGQNARKVFDRGLEERVATLPGSPFFPDGTGENTMRLNFSNAPPDMIREGIKRLARAFTAVT